MQFLSSNAKLVMILPSVFHDCFVVEEGKAQELEWQLRRGLKFLD